MTKQEIKTVITNPLYFLAFGLGLGFSPIAPGTAGTLLGVVLYYLIYIFNLNLLFLACLSSIVGIYICGVAARALNYHDHPGIVWDEVAGYLITMIFVPYSLINIVLGFIIFRIYDIAKPWPIRAIDQKVNGGVGIMLDDILAGIYSCLSLHLILYFMV